MSSGDFAIAVQSISSAGSEVKNSRALLPDTRRQDALSLAERVRARSKPPPNLSKNYTIRELSALASHVERSPDDLASLLKVADQALYRAKAAGRNRVQTSPYAAEHVPLRRPNALSIHKRSAA